MDNALRNALARQEELKNKISALELTLQAYNEAMQKVQKFIADWHEFAKSTDIESNISENSSLPIKEQSVARTTRARGNPRKEKVAEITREIIIKHGVPIRRAELMDILKDYGVHFSGFDTEKVLSTMLWRMQDQVINLRGYGYWLTERPYPPANYAGKYPFSELL